MSAAFVGVLVAMLATFSSGFVYVTLIERMDANNAALAALFAAVAFAPVYGLAPAAIGIVAGIALRQGAGAKSVWLVGALSAAAGAGTAWLLDGMWIADALNLSRAEVHGVVSFYHHFRERPAGQHIIKLCRAEACQSMNADALAEFAKRRLQLDFGKSSYVVRSHRLPPPQRSRVGCSGASCS